MKVLLYTLVAVAIVQGLSLDARSVQAECHDVYLSLYDPVQDPPCGSGANLSTSWTIFVNSSPSSISAGSCSSFTLDNLYTGVVFYSGPGCGVEEEFTCDIVATDSNLSGYYQLTVVNGACITICATCTP